MRSRRADTPIHRPSDAAAPAGNTAEALRLIARSPALIAQAIGFSGLVFVLVGYLTWMPTILTERFGLSLAEAGFQAVFLHHLLGYGGLLAAGWASDRWLAGRAWLRLIVMGVALILAAPWIWLSGAAASPTIVYLALGLFGLTRGVYDANLFAGIFDHAPDRLRATVTSWIVACAYLAGAAAPTAMGALKQHHGIAAGMKMLAGVALGSGATFLAIVWSTRRHGRAA